MAIRLKFVVAGFLTIFSLAILLYFWPRPSTSSINRPLQEISLLYLEDEKVRPTLEEVIIVAKERQEEMSRLAWENPEAFLENVLTPEEVNQLPPEIKSEGLVEESKTVTGSLVATQLENFTDGRAEINYAIRVDEDDNEGLYALTMTEPIKIDPNLIGGETTANGVAIEGRLVVETESSQNLLVTPMEATAESWPSINKNVLIIAFNFINDKNNPSANEELETQVFSDPESARNYFYDSSYGQANLTGRAVGPFTIPMEKKENQCNDYASWAIAADAAAFANGVDVNNYQYRVYSFPRPDNCWAGAWADIGGNPSRVYLPGRQTTGVVVHELGHSLGFNHANFRYCSVATTQNQMINNNSGCVSQEYGDPYDVMGSHWSKPRSLNAPHRDQAGWLKDSQVQMISDSGEYTLTPLNRLDGGVKTLVIPMSSVDEFYYLEYRLPSGFDATLGEHETGGLQVRAFGGYSTNILDANISLEDESQRQRYSDSSRSILLPGSKFLDRSDGLAIKLLSLDEAQALVEITLNQAVCQRRQPGVEIDPDFHSAPMFESRLFNITVTNNDTTSCAPGMFFANAYGDNVTSYYFTENGVELAPGNTFVFEFTPTFGSDSTLGEHKIKAYANSASHTGQAEAVFSLEGGLKNVVTNIYSINTKIGDNPTHLSALAYDTYSRPMWTDLTYDWSMSSSNSVGRIEADVNVADFIPLKPGHGDLTVTAFWRDLSTSFSIPADVIESISQLIVDFDHDGDVDFDDFNVLLSGFGQSYTIFDYNSLVKNFGPY